MKDIILFIVLLLIVGTAIWYIARAKKNGAKCIGCPSGGNCGCGCNCDCEVDK